MTFRRKQQYSYFRLTIIMTAVIGLSVYVFARIWQNAFWYGRILGHKIQTACGCTELSELIIMHPIIFGSVLALGVLVGTAALLAAVKFYTIWSQTRKFCRLYLNSAKANHSAKLKKTLKRMKFDKQRVAETACDDPVVFCYGWWKPKICVSSGLVAILHPAELETVLRHEEQHVISREPAKLFMFKYFYHLYFFLPGLKTLIKQYETFSNIIMCFRESSKTIFEIFGQVASNYDGQVVVKTAGGEPFVVADIPGLIEGASQGATDLGDRHRRTCGGSLVQTLPALGRAGQGVADGGDGGGSGTGGIPLGDASAGARE